MGFRRVKLLASDSLRLDLWTDLPHPRPVKNTHILGCTMPEDVLNRAEQVLTFVVPLLFPAPSRDLLQFPTLVVVSTRKPQFSKIRRPKGHFLLDSRSRINPQNLCGCRNTVCECQ